MTTPSPFAHSIAVVIGIDHYGNGVPELRTAANDAQRLGDLLAEKHGYDVTELIDSDATQARITTLLTKDLPERVGPDDRVLFYFAGHGVARDSDEGPNGYLLPVDARRGDETTYLDMPLVHDALLALSCRHMLIVLDSCFSGAFRWSGTRDVEDVVEVVHQEKFDRYVRDPAWQVITSASQDQRALDQLSAGALGSRDGDGAHSPFALALYDGLSGKGDVIPRNGGDGLVTATELYLYLDEALQNAAQAAGKEQTPRLWPLKKHDKGEFVFFVPDREMSLPPAPPLTFENNPWRGLASYDAANAALFFGRDAETDALRVKIESTPLTVVLGASGTGKSSLVKAGVVPRLVADGAIVLPIVRPGSAPLVAIAAALTADGAAPPEATPAAISARIAQMVGANAGRKLVLVIDQFEELITLVRTRAERDVALGLLAALTTTHADALRVIVTIRTDFEPNFDRSAFGERWRDGRYVVPPMSRANLRAVVEKPATARVLYFDPSSLVDTLLDDVVATPGALPLLSFALSEMYIAYVKRQSSDRAITRADYDALGGVVGALRARAESEYAALDDANKATLRRVMLRLVTSEGGGLARRRVLDAELDFADADEKARAANVVQRLTAARLLVEGKEPDGEAFVEPAHDALVRGWGRLLEWVREENEAKFPLLQQQKLARAADEWDREDGGKDSGLLWSDSSRSAQLSPLVRRKAPFLNRREMAFAQRSVRGRWIAIATAVAAVLAIAVAGVVAVIGGIRASARAEQVRIGAIVRTATAMVSDDPLVAGQLLGSIDSATVANLDDATSLAMLGAALELRRGPRVLATFDSDEEVTTAVLSPDGRLVATGILNGVVQLFRADGTGTPLTLREKDMPVLALRFSPGSDRLAVGDLYGVVRLWRADGHGSPIVLRGDTTQVMRMQFNHAGTRVLVTHAGGAVAVWNADGSGAPTVIASDKVTVTLVGQSDDSTTLRPVVVGADAAEFADGDAQVVTAMRDSTVQFWPSTGVRPRPLRTARLPQRRDVTRLAVSPDGRRVAVGGRDGVLEIIDLSTRAKPVQLRGHIGDITSVAWNPAGTAVVSTAADTMMMVFRAGTGTRLRTFRHSGEAMETADFSPDGRHILTTTEYSFQATVWAMDSSIVTLAGHTNALVSAELASDSRRVLTASKDGSVWLWSLPDPPLYAPVRRTGVAHPEGADVVAAAFSPASGAIAVGTRDGAVLFKWRDSVSMTVIDTSFGTIRALSFSPQSTALRAMLYDGTRRRWTLPGGVRTVTPSTVDEVAISSMVARDGRHVLAMTELGAAQVWDLDSKTPPMRLQLLPIESICAGQDGDADCADPNDTCAALSDDGALLAVCSENGPAVAYRVPDTTAIRTFINPDTTAGAASAAAFSHDATRLAVGYDDGSIRVYRLDVPDTGRVFTGHRYKVTRLDFAPDGKRLLSAARDGTVRVWDLVGMSSVVTIRPKGLVVQSARFTEDGRRVITLGAGESDARLWNANGTGGFVAIRVPRGEVYDIFASRDDRWMLVASTAQTAHLVPLDPNLAIAPFRATRSCLPMNDRERYLMESSKDAMKRHGACERSRRAEMTGSQP